MLLRRFHMARQPFSLLPTMLLLAFILLETGCSADAGRHEHQPAQAALREALTFYASFDGQADADFARGDHRIYTAPAMASLNERQPGLPGDTLVQLVENAGRYGDALRISLPSRPLLFFRGENNMPYEQSDWSGTVSLWLSLDPDEDLAPGYSDPLLITPRSWNDASIFVDFTRDDTPRRFRFAAFADRDVWDPERRDWSEVPVEERPMVEVDGPYFARDRWTHVVMTFENFNTGQPNGILRCYLDGAYVGSLTGQELTYTWDPAEVGIVLGIDYIGLVDELSIFDRALTDQEVQALYALEGGVSSLLE